jgi:hypothetical protein
VHRQRRVHAAAEQRLVPELRERTREHLLALREHARAVLHGADLAGARAPRVVHPVRRMPVRRRHGHGQR